jgi:hypothetical protein
MSRKERGDVVDAMVLGCVDQEKKVRRQLATNNHGTKVQR